VADRVVGLDQYTPDAVVRETERNGEADGAAADDRDAMPVRVDTVVAGRQMRGMALGDERVGLEVDIHRWLPGESGSTCTRAGAACRQSKQYGSRAGIRCPHSGYGKPTGIYPDSVIASRVGSRLQAEREQLALARDAQAPVRALLVCDDARRLHADRLADLVRGLAFEHAAQHVEFALGQRRAGAA
jgi:hypothetical protein